MPAILAHAHRGCSEPRSCGCILHASYQEEREDRGHAGYPVSCTSRLLRAVILCLHPSASVGVCSATKGGMTSGLPNVAFLVRALGTLWDEPFF
jgi:hypothetical protein